jgi:hypothetical protein
LLSQGVAFEYNSTDLANGFNLTSLFPFGIDFTDTTFSIKFIDDKMYVSTDVRDSNNTLIAEIVNNEWKTVNPDTLQFWDRNYNNYAFEIIGSNNIPTLQVIMVGSNEIQVGGLFFTQTGSIYIAPMINGSGTRLFINVGDKHQEYNTTIPTIFKYPCLTNPDNLGEMNSSFYPSSNPLLIPTFEFGLGIILMVISALISYFAYDSYSYLKGREREKQERANRRSKNLSRQLGRVNSYYRKRRDRKSGKKN